MALSPALTIPGNCDCSTKTVANDLEQMHLGNGTNINVGYGECWKTDYFVNPGDLTYPGPLGSCI